MLLSSIKYITDRLNAHFKNIFELNEDIVVVSNLMENDGSAVPSTNNKVVVFLANMEKDTMPKQRVNHVGSNRVAVTNAPIYLNLSIVIAANFTGANYLEALKFISTAITFFQQQPVFNHENSPDLPPNIEKLILEIENIPRQDLSSMWSMFGAKYIPSIVYRVRMVTINSNAVLAQHSIVNQPQPQLEKLR
ncbi:MAG: hypothetical protein ACJAV1_001138 [Paraglaciecola sp.]|jgi:hypothetical protein